MKEYYTATEASEMLSVSRQAIWKWISEGKIKAHKPEGARLVRIKREELEKFINSEK